MLKRYWVQLESQVNAPEQTIFEYGVTAYDLEDALNLIRQTFYVGKEFPQLSSHVENVDISKLNGGKPLYSMGIAVKRGVWFPVLS
jgi:hypothetical protein